MPQLQFFKYTTLGLLLLNVAMIAFFFFTKPPHPPHAGDLKKKAVDILKMDDQQHDSFLQLAKAHQQEMIKLNSQQRKTLQQYFHALIDYTQNNRVFLDQIQETEKEKVLSTYQHFLEVQQLLEPDQLVNFEPFVNTALNRILLHSPRQAGPPK